MFYGQIKVDYKDLNKISKVMCLVKIFEIYVLIVYLMNRRQIGWSIVFLIFKNYLNSLFDFCILEFLVGLFVVLLCVVGKLK